MAYETKIGSKIRSCFVPTANDDFTTMEFVIFVLEYVFNLTNPSRFYLLKVHNEGVGKSRRFPI